MTLRLPVDSLARLTAVSISLSASALLNRLARAADDAVARVSAEFDKQVAEDKTPLFGAELRLVFRAERVDLVDNARDMLSSFLDLARRSGVEDSAQAKGRGGDFTSHLDAIVMLPDHDLLDERLLENMLQHRVRLPTGWITDVCLELHRVHGGRRKVELEMWIASGDRDAQRSFRLDRRIVEGEGEGDVGDELGDDFESGAEERGLGSVYSWHDEDVEMGLRLSLSKVAVLFGEGGPV